MSSSSNPHRDNPDDAPEVLHEDEVAEVVETQDADGDLVMDDGDDDNEELVLENHSIAYFDGHKDSVFCIAQHPLYPNLVATGGSEGDADDAPGKGYVLDTSVAASRPVLPPSYNSDPSSRPENTALQPLFAIDGHTDSINALAFTLPRGEFLVSGGMDGRLRVYAVSASSPSSVQFRFLAESRETEEVNWLAPCPSADYPNTIAFGASDGSVWVLTLDASDPSSPIQIVQTYYVHSTPCTAGAWSPDGLLLATVSEDSSLHVFDVWGAAAAQNLVTRNGQTVVSLTSADQRFEVEGGLYSVAVSPSGAFVAVGGAGGAIRIVGLPRLFQQPQQQQSRSRQQKSAAGSSSQAGAILAAISVQTDSVESLAFSPTAPLLAAGSVDGSIAVFDTARSFALRRHLRAAHDGEAVVKLEFVRAATGPAAGWLLTSCGLDGVVRRWDLRGATAGAAAGQAANAAAAGQAGGAGNSGLVKEWRGHRGGGEGGGVLGFVQGETGERVVTAGDDAVVLVFEA